MNVTVPVGVAEPDACVTVAVKVTTWPDTDGLADEVSVVVVAGLFTVMAGLVFAVIEPSVASVAVRV